MKSFSDNGSTFLAFANFKQGEQHNINSPIYKWNGSHFVPFQSIPTRGAFGLHPFMMCSQTFLGIANHLDDDDRFNTKSVIYRFSQEQFTEYQEISTQGAFDMTSFQAKAILIWQLQITQIIPTRAISTVGCISGHNTERFANKDQ